MLVAYIRVERRDLYIVIYNSQLYEDTI